MRSSFKGESFLKYLFIFLYLSSVVSANIATAHFHPLNISHLIIPIGTFFIGLTFLFRDYVQNQIGKEKTYLLVVIALIASALTSYFLGDTLWIVFASALTFAISETIDTEIFSRIRKSFFSKVLLSGFFSSLLDSFIFVIIGLSPLGAGFVPWNAIGYAVIGQIIFKFLIQFVILFIFQKILLKKYIY